MSLFFLLPTGTSVVTTYSLDGQSISDSSTSRTCTAGVRINADGTVDSLINTTYTQIDVLTDWIRPTSEASADYDVRVTNVVWTSGAAFDAEAAAEDTWIDLGSDREWYVQDADSGGAGTKLVTFDIEIRDPEGTTVATGSYTLEAEYNNA